MLAAILAALVLAGADQFIKYLIVQDFALGESRQFLAIGGKRLMDLTYVLNDGAAFSSMAGKRILLIAVPCLLLVFCVWLLRKYGRESRFVSIALAMIMGGGMGNLYDRIFNHGKVIDYLEWKPFQFAIFNFADCLICVGCALVFLYFLFTDDKKKPESAAADPLPVPEAEETSHD